MRQTAILIFVILFRGLTQAQDPDTIHSNNSCFFSLYTGLTNNVTRDDAMSPFKYRGHSIPVEISYSYFSTKNRQIFYASFDNLRLRSSLPNFENAGLNHYVQSTNFQMGYSYLLRAVRLTKYQCDLYLGGEISSFVNLRQHAYIQNNEYLMIDQFNSLGFKAQFEKRFGNTKQTASVSLSIPLVSYVLMGDTYNAFVGSEIDPLVNYSGNMLYYLAKKGDFVSFNRLVYFKTDFSLVHFVGSHLGIEGRVCVRYYKYTQYQDLNFSRNLQNQFLAGIVYRL